MYPSLDAPSPHFAPTELLSRCGIWTWTPGGTPRGQTWAQRSGHPCQDSSHRVNRYFLNTLLIHKPWLNPQLSNESTFVLVWEMSVTFPWSRCVKLTTCCNKKSLIDLNKVKTVVNWIWFSKWSDSWQTFYDYFSRKCWKQFQNYPNYKFKIILARMFKTLSLLYNAHYIRAGWAVQEDRSTGCSPQQVLWDFHPN